MDKPLDYNKIMSDKNLFNETIYTTLSDAIKILEERQKDPKIIKKIEELLKGDIPEPLNKIGKYGINEKQVATPSYDTKWFIDLTQNNGLLPVFFEYHSDKFTSNNHFKHSLGQLRIHDNHNDKKGDNIEEKITIVDFNKYNGKPLCEVNTLWGEPLILFHKRLFEACDYKINDIIFSDFSGWLKRNGGSAEKYYEKDLLLYICHGILFENFLMTDDTEGNFTRNIFLPAFEKVIKLTGLKPLIVPIPPMDNEEDSHWISYNKIIKTQINLINS